MKNLGKLIKKSKEEANKLRNELRAKEIKINECEQENTVIKQIEGSTLQEFNTEKHRLVIEVKSLREEIKKLQSEISRKDSELHASKIEIEKGRIEILDHLKDKRKLENDLTRLDDQIKTRLPVMMKDEVIIKKDNVQQKNKKACLFELDQMMKQYRNELSRDKIKDGF